MTVRLKELVEQAADKDMVLVAGKGGLERPVRWVHMVENEEIAGFLKARRSPSPQVSARRRRRTCIRWSKAPMLPGPLVWW